MSITIHDVRRGFGALACPFCAVLIFAVECALFMGPTQAYSYLAYYVTSFSMIKAIASALGVFLIACALSKETNAVTVGIWLLFIFVLIPMFVVYTCRDQSTFFMAASASSFLGAALFASGFRIRDEHRVSKKVASNKIYSWMIKAIILFAVLLILYMIMRHGMPGLGAINLEDTYAIRSSSSYSGAETALLNLFGNYVLPLLIIFLLTNGEYRLAVFASLCMLILFLWTANKTWLLIVPFIWLFYYLVHRETRIITYLVSFCAILTAFLVGSLLYTVGSRDPYSYYYDWIYSLGITRAMLLPGALKFEYFEFANSHEHVGFIDTVFEVLDPSKESSPYMNDPYPMQIARYTSGENALDYSWFDTGLFGNDYIHFGVFSFFFITIALCGWWLCVKECEGTPSASFIAIVNIYVMFLMRDKSVTSISLSLSGLAFIVLIFIFVRAKNSSGFSLRRTTDRA